MKNHICRSKIPTIGFVFFCMCIFLIQFLMEENIAHSIYSGHNVTTLSSSQICLTSPPTQNIYFLFLFGMNAHRLWQHIRGLPYIFHEISFNLSYYRGNKQQLAQFWNLPGIASSYCRLLSKTRKYNSQLLSSNANCFPCRAHWKKPGILAVR